MNRVPDRTQWAGKHAGETCLVIANGPGLATVPVEFLKKYPTFACNRFHIYHGRTGFAPTYYVSMAFEHYQNPQQREYVMPMLAEVRAAFMNRLLAHQFPFDNIWTILSGTWYGYPPQQRAQFSYDPLNIIGIGPSMAYGMLQIAFYMGFTTVLIVGLDHEYDMQSDRKHFYKDGDAPHWEVAPGPKRTPARWIEECDFTFQLAKHAYDMAGRKLINLSSPTACTIFQKAERRGWE